MGSSEQINAGVGGEQLYCVVEPNDGVVVSPYPWEQGASTVLMTPVPAEPPTEGEGLRTYIGENSPPYCECARLAKRPLSWAFWSDLFSDNRTLASLDLEFSHSHLIFEQSGDNVGFGQHGLFAEDVGSMEYRYEPECYDGESVRQAVREQDPPSSYWFITKNCQEYAKKILGALGLR